MQPNPITRGKQLPHLRCIAGISLSLAIGFFSPFAGATNEVERGLSWLAQQVQPVGSVSGESASIATPFQVRVETHSTLKQLSTAPGALADQVAAEPEDSTEYVARKIGVLASVGRDVSAPLAALLAAQNDDGGFGAGVGFQSNALDTAYALLALKAASPGNSTAIGNALGYLRTTQGTDGSFGINDQPSVYITCAANHLMRGRATG